MYKTIIMPVDVFEMALSDKAVRHAEFLAQQDGVIHLLHVLPGSASFTMSRFTADLRRFEEHLQHEAETRLQTVSYQATCRFWQRSRYGQRAGQRN